MKARKYSMLLLVIPLLLSGCLINPVTGKLGPSWNIPLQIPLIHETIVLGDELEEIDRDKDSGLFFLNFFETQSISIDDLDLTISDITLADFDYEIPSGYDVSITTKLPNLDYDQVEFAAGALVINSSVIDFESLNIGGEQLTRISSDSNSSTYELANVVIKANSEIKIEGTTSIPDLDDTEITLSFNKIELKQVVGIVERTPVNIGNHSMDMDLDWPEELDDFDIKLAGTSLSLTIENRTGIEVDLNDLEIIAETNAGEMALAVTDGFGVVPANDTNILILTADNSNINKVFDARPTKLEVKGTVFAGNDHVVTTFDFSETEIDLSFEMTVQSIFEIKPGGFVYNSEPQTVDVTTDALDALDDLTNDTISFHANIKNGLPLGLSLEMLLSTLENPADDPEAKVFEFEISREEVETSIMLEVDQATRDILRRGAYSEILFTIPNDSNEPLLISLRETDSISAAAWVELEIKVNK